MDKAEEGAEQVETLRYGWLQYRPSFLQCCLSSKWILSACCFLVLAESFVVSGLTGVIITSLERRFYLRSFQVGGIITCYEVSAAVLALLVSYYGHLHKAKWLGVGATVLGLGCVVFALPHFLSGEYEPVVGEISELCHHNASTQDAADDPCRHSAWYNIFIFVLGQLLIGAGASPIYNLCAAYLDENVSRKSSGVYLAVFFTAGTLGPGLGFILGGYFLTIYVDIEQLDGVDLEPEDRAWVGAWWLGFLFGGILLLFASIPLLGFPRELPKFQDLRAEKKLAEDTVPDGHKPRNVSEFLPALKSIFQNKVFLFTTIAATAEAFALSGGTFFPKFIESQYRMTSSDASLYIGGVVVPGIAVGILLGGYIIRKFKWTCAECVKVNTVMMFLSALTIFVFFVHCPNMDVVKMTSSNFENSTRERSLEACYETNNCSCTQNYIPVCSKTEKITYFSPCHIGCTGQAIVDHEKVYTNCSCLSGNATVVHEGRCEQSCDSLPYFLGIIFLMVVVVFTTSIPTVTVTLRCVPESQGSFALGVQQFIAKLFAFIPAPIVFGALLDTVCILPQTDPCDENSDRNCLEYQNQHFSYVFFGTFAVCKTTSVTFFALAWYFYKPPKQNNNAEELVTVENPMI